MDEHKSRTSPNLFRQQKKYIYREQLKAWIETILNLINMWI